MQLEEEIKFNQLVELAKKLPTTQWIKLKQEVDSATSIKRTASDLETLLLSAPTFTKKQINDIDKTRKAINQWRTS